MDKDLSTFHKKFVHLIRGQQYQKASKLILSHVEPHTGTFFYYKASLQYFQEKYATAILLFKRALRDPHLSAVLKESLYKQISNAYAYLEDWWAQHRFLKRLFEEFSVDPHLHEAYLKLLCHNKAYQEAERHIQCYATQFVSVETFRLAAETYSRLHKYEKALPFLEKAQRLDPYALSVYIEFSFIYKQIAKAREAIVLLKKFFADPKSATLKNEALYPVLLMDLALHESVSGDLEAALLTCEKAFRLQAKSPDIIATYHRIARYTCAWDKVQILTPLLETVINEALRENRLVPERPWLHVTRSFDKAKSLAIAKNAVDVYLTPLLGKANVEKFQHYQRKKNSRIRVGYCSADFYNHATMHLLGHLFSLHDKEKFEIFVYNYGLVENTDPYYAMVAQESEHLKNLGHLSALEIASCIYEDNIDILVDLKGYTTGARTEIFLAKPAPIQIQFLGYPGTMGTALYDYVITDEIVTPATEKKYYAEKFLYLPNSYQITDDKRYLPAKKPSKQRLGLPEDKIILASFNQSLKIEKETFELWLSILADNPNAVLWIYANDPAVALRLTQFAKQHGQQENKLFFAKKCSHDQHLMRLQQADLLLDPLICNGHTSTSDALWVGVPVLTCLGAHFASRVSASLLHAVNLAELVTESPKAYLEKVTALCRDPESLAQLKQHLIQNRKNFPLFNTAQYVRDLEQAYLKVMPT